MITDFEALVAEDRRDIPALVIPELPPRRKWFVVPPVPAFGGALAFVATMFVQPWTFTHEPAASSARWHWLIAGAATYLVLVWREQRSRPALERQVSGAMADLATGIAAIGCLAFGALAVTHHIGSSRVDNWATDYAYPRYVGAAGLAIVLGARAIGTSLRPREAPIELATCVQIVGVSVLVTLFGLLLFASPVQWSGLVEYANGSQIRGKRLLVHVVELTSFEAISISASIVIAIWREHPALAALERRAALVVGAMFGLLAFIVYVMFDAHPSFSNRIVASTLATVAVSILIGHIAVRRRRRLLSLYSANRPASTASGS
ncbi:MAG: hypothetical protein QM831_38325 [Kofleriaceae bacterium]